MKKEKDEKKKPDANCLDTTDEEGDGDKDGKRGKSSKDKV